MQASTLWRKKIFHKEFVNLDFFVEGIIVHTRSGLFWGVVSLSGFYTLIKKLACFMLYLKIVNTFLINNICIL